LAGNYQRSDFDARRLLFIASDYSPLER